MPVWLFWCILAEGQPLWVGQGMRLLFSPYCGLGYDPSHLQREPQVHIYLRGGLISLEVWEAPSLQGGPEGDQWGRRGTMLCLPL